MSRFISINLKNYYNHKMIYEQTPEDNKEEEFGLDNIYILKTDIKLHEKDILENVNFKFEFQKLDNVVCEGQRIEVNALATQLHIIGFTYWGDTDEYFKVVYSDFSEQMIRLPFIDWSHEAYKESRDDGYAIKTSTIRTVITSGALIHLAYFHHITCELINNKCIKEIILPDNMFIHIFAMTLENDHIEN